MTRAMTRGVTLAAALVVAAMALSAGGAAQAATATPAQRCLPAGPITAASYQALFNSWHDAAFSGADQSYSTLLPDGRTLWLFADTEQGSITADGARGSDRRVVHNSFMIWNGRCAHMVDPGGHAALMPDDSDGSYYWSSVAGIDAGKLQVFALHTRTTGPGTMDFSTDGTTLFTFSVARGGEPVLSRKQAVPGEGEWQWGAAITADSHYVYIYGTAASTVPFAFGKDVRVARAPKGSLANFAAWTYWAGDHWSTSLEDAATVLNADNGPSSTFSVLPHSDGTWELVSKQYDMLGDYVAAWSAPTPVGPWTIDNPQVLYAPSFAPTENTMLYNSFLHPAAQLTSGKLLLTVDRNTLSTSEFQADANAYMPQFFEVDPAAVGGSLRPVTWPSQTAVTAPARPVGWGSSRATSARPSQPLPVRRPATRGWGVPRRR